MSEVQHSEREQLADAIRAAGPLVEKNPASSKCLRQCAIIRPIPQTIRLENLRSMSQGTESLAAK